MCKEFVDGSVKKEYIARCAGQFPECVGFSRTRCVALEKVR